MENMDEDYFVRVILKHNVRIISRFSTQQNAKEFSQQASQRLGRIHTLTDEEGNLFKVDEIAFVSRPMLQFELENTY